MKSFEEQAAFGLAVERRIAETAMTLLYPARDDVSLFRLPELSKIDYLVVDERRVLCALEIKRRAIKATAYNTTIIPQTVYDAAIKLERVNIPTYAAVLFTDGLLVFDVLAKPSEVCYIRTRQGRLRAHRAYAITKGELYAA